MGLEKSNMATPYMKLLTIALFGLFSILNYLQTFLVILFKQKKNSIFDP